MNINDVVELFTHVVSEDGWYEIELHSPKSPDGPHIVFTCKVDPETIRLRMNNLIQTLLMEGSIRLDVEQEVEK